MDSIPKFIENKSNPGKRTYITARCWSRFSPVTYGCIVYQEQVIEIFRDSGRLHPSGQADNIRRAISKKKQKVIDAERKTFVHGEPGTGNRRLHRKRGVPEAAAQAIYDEIRGFRQLRLQQGARGVLCQWSPTRRPTSSATIQGEYMAALMTSVLDICHQNLRLYRRVPGAWASRLLPPDINALRGLLHRRGATPSASASAR